MRINKYRLKRGYLLTLMEQVILADIWTENKCKFLSRGIFRDCLEEEILTECLAL